MTRFEGICYGGPLDGKWLAHSGPVFRVVKHGPLAMTVPLSVEDVAAQAMQSVETQEYVIDCLFTDKTGRKVFMWQIDGEKKSAIDVLEDLLDSYSRLADLKR